MHRCRILLLALTLGSQGLVSGHAQQSAANSSSSDDISVADGLQLPVYGRIWTLDTWKGVRELVQLGSIDTAGDTAGGTTGTQTGWTLKPRHPFLIQGEAAKVRIHDAVPEIFLHVPAGQGSNASSPFAIVRLTVTGQNRQITKAASEDLLRARKGADPQSEDLIELNQKQVGTTNWYRLSPKLPLSAGEYAIVPLPGSQGTSPGEIYDFAIDPGAPENLKPLRSERDRPAE